MDRERAYEKTAGEILLVWGEGDLEGMRRIELLTLEKDQTFGTWVGGVRERGPGNIPK